MRSIHHHYPPPPLSTLNHQHAPSGSGGVFPRYNFYLPVVNPVRSKAMAITTSHLVVLSVNSPATTGDLTVLIPTSLAFLFLYWIANFVVPGFVMKDLQSDDASKDENPNEEGFKTTRMVRSMKDLLMSSRDSSPVREKAGLNFSTVKSLVLRDKEDKIDMEFGTDEKVKVVSLISSLLGAEGHLSGRKSTPKLETNPTIISLLKDLHAAPPDSFVVELAEAIGCLKTLRKMASFWYRVVAELRRLWCDGQHIPGIPVNKIPDLNCCLLYQQLQVINCCISRKKRRTSSSVESVMNYS